MSHRNRSLIVLAGCAAAALAAGSASGQLVLPTLPHAAYNFIPFGTNQVCTQHQVFDASLFGSDPVEIRSLGFASNPARNGLLYESDIVVRVGYTDAIPGVGSAQGGLSVDLSQNPRGPMTEVFNDRVSVTLQSANADDFSFVLQFDPPWCYDPREGNLLVELFSDSQGSADNSVSRAAGSSESSRAYNSTRFTDAESPTTATRMEFELGPCEPAGPEISLSGDPCPGRKTLRWTGAEPNRPAAIAIASGTGSFVIPGGPCVGTQLGLNSTASLLSPPGQFSTGPNGEGSFSGNAGGGACGRFLQMVVFQSGAPPCDTSNVVQIN